MWKKKYTKADDYAAVMYTKVTKQWKEKQLRIELEKERCKLGAALKEEQKKQSRAWKKEEWGNRRSDAGMTP